MDAMRYGLKSAVSIWCRLAGSSLRGRYDPGSCAQPIHAAQRRFCLGGTRAAEPSIAVP